MPHNPISQKIERPEIEPQFALDSIIRDSARKLLQQAIENEVSEYCQRHQDKKDEIGHRLVTRNGYLPEREILSGVGPLSICQPRVRDKREGHRFTSSILPPFARRTPSVQAVLPTLYLKGLSTGDFSEALEALLGENAKGLSAANICRLKQCWEKEYMDWLKRDLRNKRYVYIWADGIYFNVRLSDERPCILVLIGALADGTKELIAVMDGQRESTLSWKELLLDLQARGIKEPPQLAIGDGAMGFWSALEEVFPSCKHQRCWVHKTANILDKMAKGVQPSAKRLLHEMYMSETKRQAHGILERFVDLYQAKYPKACECLLKDQDQLFVFYDFPAMHWQHIRSTNPIESTFATVRHRTRQTKGCGSRTATLTMVFKLALEAEKSWKRLKGYELMSKVVIGVIFRDGEEVNQQEKEAAA